MNKYEEMRTRHQHRFDEWANEHMFFAFDDRQFIDGMRRFGLDPVTDQDKLYKTGTGGFYRQTDAAELKRIVTENWKEFEDAIAADRTGDGFIYDAFISELRNHEYDYTGDPTDALDSLNMEPETVRNDLRLLHGLKKAMLTINGCTE